MEYEERFKDFAYKVLRSEEPDFKTLLKSFPDFKISQGTHLYHMVDVGSRILCEARVQENFSP